MGGSCSKLKAHVRAQLFEPASAQLLEPAPRSDKHAVLDVSHAPRSDKQPALDVERTEVRSAGSIESGQPRAAEQPRAISLVDRRDTDQPDPDIDPSTLPYRIFLRGAMIGCAIVAMPMAVLLWIVVSNGILYRFYPLPREVVSS